jgi:hypothetical protein
MKKKLFQNYSFTFDKNEKKVLRNFCKQALNQMSGDDRFYKEEKIFNSLIDKFNSGEEEIKLTKEEKQRLVLHLKENVKHIKQEMDKSGFLKKWFYNSVYKQYKELLQNHFSD